MKFTKFNKYASKSIVNHFSDTLRQPGRTLSVIATMSLAWPAVHARKALQAAFTVRVV